MIYEYETNNLESESRKLYSFVYRILAVVNLFERQSGTILLIVLYIKTLNR
jgi:hypothetical protein